MFRETLGGGRWHHSFRLRCDQDSKLLLTDDFEFHIVELPKFRPEDDNITRLPTDQKWLYLFTHAAEMEPEQLSDLLGEGTVPRSDWSARDDFEKPLKTTSTTKIALSSCAMKKPSWRRERRGTRTGTRTGTRRGTRGRRDQTNTNLQEILGEPVSAQSELGLLSLDQLHSMAEEFATALSDVVDAGPSPAEPKG